MFFPTNDDYFSSQNEVYDERPLIKELVKDDYYNSLFVKSYLVTIPLFAVEPTTASYAHGLQQLKVNDRVIDGSARPNICSIPIDQMAELMYDGVGVAIHKEKDIIEVFRKILEAIDITNGVIPTYGYFIPKDRIDIYIEAADVLLSGYNDIITKSYRKKLVSNENGLVRPNQRIEKEKVLPRYDFNTGERIC